MDRSRLIVIYALLWLAAAGGGLWIVWSYGGTPGDTAIAPSGWPPDLEVQPDPSRPTLLLIAHPMCDCTEATLAELLKLTSRCGNRVALRIVFVRPEGMSEERVRSGTWEDAEDIPGAAVSMDGDGEIARRFGVRTSGHALLFDRHGLLLFNGGITPARGQRGDNRGSQAIELLVLSGAASISRTPVFGCGLFSTGDDHDVADDDSSTAANDGTDAAGDAEPRP